MSANKTLTYGRYILVTVLVAYLILVWMYFKDNALQLTPAGLLLWFVVIPLLLVGSILALRWLQKKQDNKTVEHPEMSTKQEDIKAPDSHNLFMYSSICLPEGMLWGDIIDNDEDFTTLSEELTDFDGLPILIKPIAELTDAATLPYQYMHDEHLEDANLDTGSAKTNRSTEPNSQTLRLCSLIHEQISLSDDIFSIIAEHFNQHYQHDIQQPNSAAHVHPEWQQRYLVSADQDSTDIQTESSSTALSHLPIYLCIPASADAAILTAAVEEQMATYGIAESLTSITLVMTDDINTADNAETYNPAQFIDEQLVSLSQSASPELRLLIIVESQINEEWLELQLGLSDISNVIPTESGVLLAFYNQAANEVLDISTTVGFSFTEFCAADKKNNDMISHTDHRMANQRSYLNNLKDIKNLLIANSLSLPSINNTEPNTSSKSIDKKTKAESNSLTSNTLLSETSITMLSDISLASQPYDMSVFMGFIDEFIAQGALVTEHHLGHHMPMNIWLKPFISLALFVDLVTKDQQESDHVFLVTQHHHCSILWLADFSQTS